MMEADSTHHAKIWEMRCTLPSYSLSSFILTIHRKGVTWIWSYLLVHQVLFHMMILENDALLYQVTRIFFLIIVEMERTENASLTFHRALNKLLKMQTLQLVISNCYSLPSGDYHAIRPVVGQVKLSIMVRLISLTN